LKKKIKKRKTKNRYQRIKNKNPISEGKKQKNRVVVLLGKEAAIEAKNYFKRSIFFTD